ncbi:aminoglycoside phosphotransferase family protein [Qipengyuania atrilutea]|uniref:Phosphotransferase n=1 Tax=Qipengyuania atrilutea TaxID=2744473 RepID=A0A850H132_9SPHN|nr:phosphotransferase [Actirhodobacter atriluteus]NVD44230.1 phosphotransferase [Actirhodobacter atriluteus]
MSDIPAGTHEFLQRAGWGDSKLDPLPGDASFRRYFRVKRGDDESAMLMYAPPPHEDPKPFIDVARWLGANDLRAPEILAAEPDRGWVLIEDFGNDRVREHLDRNPHAERDVYRTAVDALAKLHRLPPGPFPPYDMETYLREAMLFSEWYCPAAGLKVDADAFAAAWQNVLGPLIARQTPGVTVLRDYHAENIMLPPDGSQGLIDFQDALVGHPAYDLVSILQDARRDVSPDLEQEMLAHYQAVAASGKDFEADYAVLGAQRNAKIVGIFVRLARRDAKPHYLSLIPRVWDLLERDLKHPALAPVAAWFDANIPAECRRTGGGDLHA